MLCNGARKTIIIFAMDLFRSQVAWWWWLNGTCTEVGGFQVSKVILDDFFSRMSFPLFDYFFYCKWGCFEAENIFFSWTKLKEKFRIKVFMKSFHELELCHKINKHWLLLSNTKALVWKENQWNLLKCFQVTISRLISVTNEKVSTRHSRFEIIHFR